MRKQGWNGLWAFGATVIGLVGCGILYGPLVGLNPDHCANSPSRCTPEQQCDVKTGFCMDAKVDMSAGAAPVVTSVSPAVGSNNVATSVSISGHHFHEHPTVTVGNVACETVVWHSSDLISCQIQPRPGTCGPQDIVVTNPDDLQSGTGTKLFTYGTTSRSFVSGARLTTDPTPWAIDAADFDKDGNLDIVAGSISNSRILLWRGKGDGSFLSTPTSFNISATAVALAAADMDHNGNLDLLVVSYDQPGNKVDLNVLQGNGAGLFNLLSQVPLSASSGINFPGMALADVNADMILDVLVSNPTANTVSVILGTATGTSLKIQSSISVASTPGPLATGDFDGDGVVDFAVSGQSGIEVANGDGTGNFVSLKSTGLLTSRAGLAAYDINRDNTLDLFYGKRNAAVAEYSLNMGNRVFGSTKTMSTVAVAPEVVRFADFDADGTMDALVTTDDSGLSQVAIFYGSPSATFTRVDISTTGARPRDAAISDFNKDGLLDFATLEYGASSVGLYLGVCK